MLLPQVPPHFSMHTFLIKDFTLSIMILYYYGMYCGFLYQTGILLHVLIENLYTRIERFAPSLQKQPQYLLTITIKFTLTSGVTLIFNLMCLCSS